MMYACYKYSDDTHSDAFEVLEEDLARHQTLDALTAYLIEFGQGKAEEKKKEKIAGSEIRIGIVQKSIDDAPDIIPLAEFWERYSPRFAEWLTFGERIKTEMKKYEGKDSYWEIDASDELVVAEHKMDDHYYYDFRTSLLSGNCFTTEEEANAFLAQIVNRLKELHGPGVSNLDIEPNFVLTATETIQAWNWMCAALWVPVHPVLYIYPISISSWSPGWEEPYRAQWNLFADEDQAIAASRAIAMLFKARSMQFPGSVEQRVYDELESTPSGQIERFPIFFS